MLLLKTCYIDIFIKIFSYLLDYKLTKNAEIGTGQRPDQNNYPNQGQGKDLGLRQLWPQPILPLEEPTSAHLCGQNSGLTPIGKRCFGGKTKDLGARIDKSAIF